MALTKHSDSDGKIYLEVKHYCLWQQFKEFRPNCEEITVTNPKTGQKSIKYGIRYDDITGRAVKLEKYDTGDKYAQRYIGWNLTIQDGAETYVLKMPYQSQMMRRFLAVSPNIDWAQPFTLKVWKGKLPPNAGDRSPAPAFWFTQGGGNTIKAYFTKDQPNGCPPPEQDPVSGKLDFTPMNRFLFAYLINDTTPRIAEAAKDLPTVSGPKVRQGVAPGPDPEAQEMDDDFAEDIPPGVPVGAYDDDEVPF